MRQDALTELAANKQVMRRMKGIIYLCTVLSFILCICFFAKRSASSLLPLIIQILWIVIFGVYYMKDTVEKKSMLWTVVRFVIVLILIMGLHLMRFI